MNQFQFGICQAYLYNTTILRKQKKMFFSNCQTNGPWFYQFRFECFLDTGYDQPESSKDESGKKKRSPHQMVVFLFFFHVMCILIFFNSYLKMAGVGNFWIGKTFFSFFQCADFVHRFIIMVCHMKQFLFLFLKKLGTGLTRTGANQKGRWATGKEDYMLNKQAKSKREKQ